MQIQGGFRWFLVGFTHIATLNDIIGKVQIEESGRDKQEKRIDSFLTKDDPDMEEKQDIARERKKAREEMDGAIKKREDEVNPKLVDILKRHYGVDFDGAGKGKVKLGATKKSKGDYEIDVERMYGWAAESQKRKEELADEYEEEMKEKCPFAPSITNKSRKIYSEKKDEIEKKREERQKKLQDLREQKQKQEQAKLRSAKKNEKDAFSRKLPKKQEKEKAKDSHDKENEDEESKIKRDRAREEELDRKKNDLESEPKKKKNEKKVTSHQADTFHKSMMEWCDRKEKNKTQKTVEHWINNFDESPERDPSEVPSKSANIKRTKVGKDHYRKTNRPMQPH